MEQAAHPEDALSFGISFGSCEDGRKDLVQLDRHGVGCRSQKAQGVGEIDSGAQTSNYVARDGEHLANRRESLDVTCICPQGKPQLMTRIDVVIRQ